MNDENVTSSINGNGHLRRNGERPLLPPPPSPAPEENLTWGSIVPSKRTYSVFQNPASKPALNKMFILATAYGAMSNGLEKVVAYHHSVYQECRAQDLAVLREIERVVGKNCVALNRQIEEFSRILSQTHPYHDRTVDNEPWTLLDRISFAFLAIFPLFMILASLNTNSVVLMNSGLAGFDNRWAGFLFSLIPAGLALTVKALRRCFNGHPARRLYTAIVGALGVGLGCVWAYLFAATFLGMTQTTSDIVNNLSQGATTNPQTSPAMVFVAILAETFIAAACWLCAENIYEKHILSKRVENPQFVKTQKDLSQYRALQRDEAELLGMTRGRIEEIEEGGKALIAEAVALFEMASGQAGQHRNLF